VSKIKENSQLQADNRAIQIYNSQVNHEMLTPLKGLVEVAKKIEKKLEQSILVNKEAEPNQAGSFISNKGSMTKGNSLTKNNISTELKQEDKEMHDDIDLILNTT
jgi:hypothetical protein